MADQKVGHSHSTMKLVKDEVVSKSTFTMSINRAGTEIEIKTEETTRETIHGDIVKFPGEMLMGGVPIVKSGKIEDNEILVREKQFFREVEKRYPLDPNGKMTWGLMKALRENDFKKKVTYSTSKYTLLILECPHLLRLKLLPWESLQ